MKVITIDFDNTIYIKKKCINKEKVNNLFENPNNFIIIYTSRSYSQFFIIKEILEKNNIKYHAIVCEKLRADCMIDDKNSNGLTWPKVDTI